MSTQWKIVRVFILSTFFDMQAEHDDLARLVLPRLREQLPPQCIHLADMDSRWGFKACREIITECRQCMLGGAMAPFQPERIFPSRRTRCTASLCHGEGGFRDAG
jgi:hypothetical protein